jgi:hypothetical protein
MGGIIVCSFGPAILTDLRPEGGFLILPARAIVNLSYSGLARKIKMKNFYRIQL